MDEQYVTDAMTSTRWTRADLLRYIQICEEMADVIPEITDTEIEAMCLALGTRSEREDTSTRSTV